MRGRKGEFRKEMAEPGMKRRLRAGPKIDGELMLRDEPTCRPLDKQQQARHRRSSSIGSIVKARPASTASPRAIEAGAEASLTASRMSSPLSSGAATEGEAVDAAAKAKGDKGRLARLSAGEGGVAAERIVLSAKYACPVSGFTIEELEPRLFSFNNPARAPAPVCAGLGVKLGYRPRPDRCRTRVKSLHKGALVHCRGRARRRAFGSTQDPAAPMSKDAQARSPHV